MRRKLECSDSSLAGRRGFLPYLRAISPGLGAHLDTATVRKRMGVVALAVPSQLSASLERDFAPPLARFVPEGDKGEGAASPSAGDSRRYNGGSVKMGAPRACSPSPSQF